MTEKGGIPEVSDIGQPNVRQALVPMRRALEILRGKIGNIRDRALRVSDLQDLGLIGVSGTTLYNPNAPSAPRFSGVVPTPGTEALIDNSGNPIYDSLGVAVLAQL